MLPVRFVECSFSFINPFSRANSNDAGLATQAGFIDCSLAAAVTDLFNGKVIDTHDDDGKLKKCKRLLRIRSRIPSNIFFRLAPAGIAR